MNASSPWHVLLALSTIALGVVIVDLVGFGIVMPVLPFYAREFGASATVLGWLLMVYAAAQFALLQYVVEQEDYATGLKQQKALRTGARDHILFGRNEEGGQRFHQWLQDILRTENDRLNELFGSV